MALDAIVKLVNWACDYRLSWVIWTHFPAKSSKFTSKNPLNIPIWKKKICQIATYVSGYIEMIHNSSSKPMICCSTDWKMKPETREHVLTIETIIYSEYQNEKSPRLDFIGGEAT